MIASQAKQLRELETLYKDELLQRRRYHNMLEDMKVRGASSVVYRYVCAWLLPV